MKTIDTLELGGKKVFIRVDFNVPLDGSGNVTDDTRIMAALPTIRAAIDAGAAVIIASHLGRPKGERRPEMSLAPVAEYLRKVLGGSVTMATDCVGYEVEEVAGRLKTGEVLLLENLRFHKEERSNDGDFSRHLAALADVYVNDAFGTAHRAHASTEGITKYIGEAAAGLLMKKELAYLDETLADPARPFLIILGGAKVSDKVGVIRNLMGRTDVLLIGGGMANTFLVACGFEVGDSKVEKEAVEEAERILEEASSQDVRILLPEDLVVASSFSEEAERSVVGKESVPTGWMALDIGPLTVRQFKNEISKAGTILWNGPMGVFEMEPFAAGTMEIAKAVADSKATSIVGGGDSVAAIKRSGRAEGISHISTGGGATLEFLEGKVLPGVEALRRTGG
ncbi:phosphoglycerate kinase [Thermodesulfobacteriota bacterium]